VKRNSASQSVMSAIKVHQMDLISVSKLLSYGGAS